MNQTLKILAIDGGGVRGYYSVKLLQHIEKELGFTAHEYFDGFCGTSTGAFISAGLGLKMSTKEIADFYTTQGEKIFPKPKVSLKLPYVGEVDTLEIKQLLKASKYESTHFKKLIDDLSMGKILSEIEKKVAITAYNISAKSAFLFHNIKDNASVSVKLTDAVLASSAAPSFLPPHAVNINGKNQLFFDGGLFANNPTLLTLNVWLEYAKQNAYSEVKILSISSFNTIKLKNLDNQTPQSLLKLKYDLLDVFLYSQSLNADEFLKNAHEIDGIKVNYLRLNGCAEDFPEPKIQINMDTVHPEAFKVMDAHADAECKNKIKEILDFYI